MRKLLLLLILITSLNIFAQYKIDFKKPESVVNAIFYAAQTKDYSILQCLCDPFGKGDGDTKRLCSLSKIAEQIKNYGGNEKIKKMLSEFSRVFEAGSISGQITFSEYEGGKLANVPIIINHPRGNKRSDETLTLVQRYGNWYLFGF